MDKNILEVKKQRIMRTIKSLEENNMNGYLVNDREELIGKIKEIVKEGSKVSCGGSMTLFETGVIEHLKSGRYEFLDRYKDGLTPQDIKNIYRESFFADAYFTSSNAITENGELYNVDGNGNRVAAMLYGPDKVIIIAGVNKIVRNLDEAIKRNVYISAPANTKRLQKKTPCAKLGYCVDCKSEERICNEYTLIKRQGNKDRIHVIFINEDFGY
ncbi:lactate utilization protein [Clostridium tepidum]|uniref:lactate utilization protein n=1 Tax=Clostridium tepidum TaxID=1962263 RepID=UPI00214A7813|nr:lactate utilization protein [Clostridium tepidum]MCR1934978.1 lactate utilization protein [Clostridium tepidum]